MATTCSTNTNELFKYQFADGEIKNTDKLLYLNSEKAKQCPHCGKRYNKRMVFHYKSAHQNCEVFVSRISPECAIKVREQRIEGIRIYKSSSQYLKAFCVFCERDHEFMLPYWTDHMRSHTGEYANQCILCYKYACFYRHCDIPTKRILGLEFNLYDNDMVAFICKECNFVQIDEGNMLNHLGQQHKLADSANWKHYYQKIVLLPSFKSVRLQANPNDVSSKGILIDCCTSKTC